MQRSAVRKTSQSQPVDAIGCVGAGFLLVILATVVVALIRGSGAGTLVASSDSPALVETSQGVGLPGASGTVPDDVPSLLAEPTALPTLPPLPTATSTATRLPSTSTATATSTASPTVTPLPTATALPTTTPLPTPVIQVLPSPTATPFPMPTLHWGISRTVRVPILMYHYVSTPPEDANEYRLDLSVEPDDFRQQMAYLAENGYTAIDFYDLTLAIADKAELPPKPVIITLDDGTRDAYENAFPILQAYGHKATFFIITELADQSVPTHMTWSMIEEMAAAGMRMEPHTKTHENLDGHDRAFLIWQIRGSQETLAAHLGYTPRYLAYPGGRYDDEVLKVVQELDLWGAVTTAGGWWHGYDDRYEWRRLRVRNTTTLSEFEWLLTHSQ